MKIINKFGLIALIGSLFFFASCTEDEEGILPIDFDFTGTYTVVDQMARPTINTVFVSSENKDKFNVTVPSDMGAAFQANFQNRLLALNPGYTTNAIGLDAASFTGVLATDVLNVSTVGKTTFFDGTNVLTGRLLQDDVIDVALTLIFGGPDGTANPGLTSDNVDSNDTAFSNNFPYLASPW